MSDPEVPEPPSRDQLMREAAKWFVLMHGSDANEHRASFEVWLRRGALHRAAYNRAAEIYAMGKVLKEDSAKDGEISAKPKVRRSLILVASSLSVAALAGLWTSGLLVQRAYDRARPTSVNSSQKWLRGAKDGLAQKLPDGSRVTLGSDSQLRVDFSDTRRAIELHRGSARFEVAHEPRPFVVLAGGGTVTARGTIFDVILSRHNKVTVTLIRGRVDVALPPQPGHARSVRSLAPGEHVEFVKPAAVEPGPDPIENQAAASAKKRIDVGRDYDEVRLVDLISQANREGNIPIRLGPGSIGDRRVSGHFRLDDSERLARRLALLLDLSIDWSEPGLIILADK